MRCKFNLVMRLRHHKARQQGGILQIKMPLQRMAWPDEDFKVISEALENVDHTKIVLGGYFTSRHVMNAFNRTCVSGTMNVRDSLELAVKDINKELLRRREGTGQ